VKEPAMIRVYLVAILFREDRLRLIMNTTCKKSVLIKSLQMNLERVCPQLGLALQSWNLAD
jgi:hypothetical protein